MALDDVGHEGPRGFPRRNWVEFGPDELEGFQVTTAAELGGVADLLGQVDTDESTAMSIDNADIAARAAVLDPNPLPDERSRVSAHGFDDVPDYRRPERRDWGVHFGPTQEIAAGWRREWVTEVFAEGPAQLERRRDEFLSRAVTEKLLDYWKAQPEAERPGWYDDAQRARQNQPDAETLDRVRHQVRGELTDRLLDEWAVERAGELAAEGVEATEDHLRPDRATLDRIGYAADDAFRSGGRVSEDRMELRAFVRERMTELVYTRPAAEQRVISEEREMLVGRWKQEKATELFLAGKEPAGADYVDSAVVKRIDAEVRERASGGEFEQRVDAKLAELRAAGLRIGGQPLPDVESPLIYVLRDSDFDPAVASVALNVDPLGGSVSPSSSAGDRQASPYFVATVDACLTRYLNTASRDPARSERLYADWNYQRSELATAVRESPRAEEGMRLVHRVYEDANAQWFTAEIHRFAGRAQIAVGADANWMPREQQEDYENRADELEARGFSIDPAKVPISRRHSPEEFERMAALYPDLPAAIRSLDPGHELGRRPRGTGQEYDRALADLIDEHGSRAVEHVRQLRESRTFGEGRLAAHPPEIPPPPCASAFVEELARLADVDARFSPDVELPRARGAHGAAPHVDFPASWESKDEPGKLQAPQSLDSGREKEAVHAAVHSVVWAARKSIYTRGAEHLPEGTRKQFAGAYEQYNRFCRSEGHDLRLAGGRTAARRAIGARTLDHVSALLASRATGTAPSYLTDQGRWHFPGRLPRESAKVDVLARSVATAQAALVPVRTYPAGWHEQEARRREAAARKPEEPVKAVRPAVPAVDAWRPHTADEKRVSKLVDRLERVLDVVDTAGVKVVRARADSKQAPGYHPPPAAAGQAPPERIVVPPAALDPRASPFTVSKAQRAVYQGVAEAALRPERQVERAGTLPAAGDPAAEQALARAFAERRVMEATFEPAAGGERPLGVRVPVAEERAYATGRDALPTTAARRLDCAEEWLSGTMRAQEGGRAEPERAPEPPVEAVRAAVSAGVRLPVGSMPAPPGLEHSSRLAAERPSPPAAIPDKGYFVQTRAYRPVAVPAVPPPAPAAATAANAAPAIDKREIPMLGALPGSAAAPAVPRGVAGAAPEPAPQRPAVAAAPVQEPVPRGRKASHNLCRRRSNMASTQGWSNRRQGWGGWGSPAVPASEHLNSVGQRLAKETRDGRAPNQVRTDLEPPKSLPKVTGQKRDGAPKIEGSRRFQGANSIVLRRVATQLRTDDPRFTTENNARNLGRTNGEFQPPLKNTSPATGRRPEPILIKSSKIATRQQRHEQDGQGYDHNGNMGPVKKGDPVRDSQGHAEQAVREGNRTYGVYHVKDVAIKVPENRPPMTAAWTKELADKTIAARCESAGEPVREATEAERVGVVLAKEMDKRINMARNDGVVTKESTKETYNFRVKDGQAIIDVPKNPEKSDLTVPDHYNSLAVACAHASQYKRAAQTLANPEITDQRRDDAQALASAYEKTPAQRVKDPAYQRAELVATYAALNEVTGHGTGYEPPASTQTAEMREAWAKELEKPGGLERIGAEITKVEVDLAARQPRADRTPEQVREQQQQQRAATRAARDGDTMMPDPYAEQTEHVRGVRQERAAQTRAATPAPDRPPAPGAQSDQDRQQQQRTADPSRGIHDVMRGTERAARAVEGARGALQAPEASTAPAMRGMLDTHAVARSLTDAEFTPAQADAITSAVRLAAKHSDHVTPDQFKAGLVEVRTEITALDTRLSAQIAGVRTEIANIETRLIRWIVGTVLVTGGLTFAILRFFG